MYKFIILLLTALLVNCQGHDDPLPFKPEKIDYLIFGRTCNIPSKVIPVKMCKLTDGHVLYTRDRFIPGLTMDSDTLPQEFYEEALLIKKNIQGYFLAADDSVYGHPYEKGNCYVYLEFKAEGRVYRYTIDLETEDLPEEIKKMTDRIETVIDQLGV